MHLVRDKTLNFPDHSGFYKITHMKAPSTLQRMLPKTK